MEKEAGINTEAINILCKEIQDESDKIKFKLNQIKDTWYEAFPYLEGSESVTFKNKYSDLESSFDNIYNNFVSYIDDFNKIVSNYEIIDSIIAKQILINAEKLKGEEV